MVSASEARHRDRNDTEHARWRPIPSRPIQRDGGNSVDRTGCDTNHRPEIRSVDEGKSMTERATRSCSHHHRLRLHFPFPASRHSREMRWTSVACLRPVLGGRPDSHHSLASATIVRVLPGAAPFPRSAGDRHSAYMHCCTLDINPSPPGASSRPLQSAAHISGRKHRSPPSCSSFPPQPGRSRSTPPRRRVWSKIFTGQDWIPSR